MFYLSKVWKQSSNRSPLLHFWLNLGQYLFPPLECVLSCLSRVRLFAIPWTVALRAPLSMGFPRQEYWSGLPFPPPGHLPNPGTELGSPASSGEFFTTELSGKPWRAEMVAICLGKLSWGLRHHSWLELCSWMNEWISGEGLNGYFRCQELNAISIAACVCLLRRFLHVQLFATL